MEYCPGDRSKSKREKYRDLLEGHTKAQHQHIIVRGKANFSTATYYPILTVTSQSFGCDKYGNLHYNCVKSS